MVDSLKAKFVAVIWGRRYVEEFGRVSLPSYLAAGNLPSLATACDLEILIMTTEESVPAIEREPAFQHLQANYRVRFIFIDDLVANGLYGVTLTLAYARAVRDSGEAQTETYFVFMNSDFVLADCSLRSLAEKMRKGERCIMAPSLRAGAEAVLPALVERVDGGSCALTMKPREMVRLALRHLHPTVIGKTVTQGFVTCTTHNQLYWQVDEHTLLGRYFLIFMLAIRPERPMPPVNSYCDYGFVPELVPSGDFSIMQDSDDFFMLELQPVAQEREFLHCGRMTTSRIAVELSRWTTREHRRFAELDVVFHAEELPERLGAERTAFSDFFENVRRTLPARPIDHVDHYYWALGLQAWRMRRLEAVAGVGRGSAGSQEIAAVEEMPPPPELEASTWTAYGAARRKSFRERLGASRLYLRALEILRERRGVFPDVSIWHHLWLDSRLVTRWTNDVSRRNGRTLVVHERDSLLASAVKKRLPVDSMIVDELPGQAGETGVIYDDILIEVRRAKVRGTARLLAAVTRMAKPGATVAVFIEHPNGELESSDFSWELARYVDAILPHSWPACRISAAFAGGRAKRRLRLVERRLRDRLWPGAPAQWPLFLVALLIGMPTIVFLTLANNLATRKAWRNCPPYCSSALLTLVGPWGSDADADEEGRSLDREVLQPVEAP